MSKKELKDYHQWFMDTLPKGINELADAVRRTPGFETWQPDCTPSSLDILGEWFAAHVEKRERTDEEIEQIKNRLTFPMEIPREELTEPNVFVGSGCWYVFQPGLVEEPSIIAVGPAIWRQIAHRLWSTSTWLVLARWRSIPST